jgi:hypothetical protein
MDRHLSFDHIVALFFRALSICFAIIAQDFYPDGVPGSVDRVRGPSAFGYSYW